MLFYISLVAFFALLVVRTYILHLIMLFRWINDVPVMFHYRAAILPHVPTPVKTLFPRLGNYRYQPLSTFSEQISAGLSSNEFDIEANVRDGDTRSGLDSQGTEEVMDIMRRERVK
jgi:hypothetical protein